jgi:hypothetical protein
MYAEHITVVMMVPHGSLVRFLLPEQADRLLLLKVR